MALLGFLFKDQNDNKRVVFVEQKYLQKDVVVGFETFLKTKDLQTAYVLKTDWELVPHIIFRSALLYTKIALNYSKVVDFRDLTCWLGVRDYKLLWSLLHIEDCTDEDYLKLKTNKALECLFSN